MDRRGFLTAGGAVGLAAALAGAARAQTQAPAAFGYDPGITEGAPLIRPEGRRIRAAFAINPGVQVIDLAGPWETFQDTRYRQDPQDPASLTDAFELYTVSETLAEVAGSGGLKLAPHYTVDDAPRPDVLVIPHFDAPPMESPETSAIHDWIAATHADAALTMSVCTGAFQLAKTGLLDGLPATTNQMYYDAFAAQFPQVGLKRGPRFVETGRIATAGGLSAGIDLALRVVARYFDDALAQRIANVMEYAGTGWRP